MIDAPNTPPTRAASPTRQARFSNILTENDAVAYIENALKTQVATAVAQQAPPNTAVLGDREVKLAFALLLTPPAQRAVFLRFIGKRECWPRIRSLVGIPPYTFLHEGDNFVLNATGICPSRTNMTAIRISANRDFAKQFTDDHGRQYRLISDDSKSKAVAVRRARLASRLVVDAMLPRQSRVDRREISKKRSTSMIFYPKVGDRLDLKLNAEFGDDRSLSCVVRTVQAPHESPVCRLYVTVL